MSLGIQGIEKKSESATTYFGVPVPGSERTKFLQYSFDAKLGLDGKNVRLEQKGEKQFTVVITSFSFIGYDNMHFELATESNGALGWFTPEAFYGGIIKAVDPIVELSFNFGNP